MGTGRRFERCSVVYGDKRVAGAVIVCGCGANEKVPANGIEGPQCDDGAKEFKILARKFAKLGWLVADQARYDRCPNCWTPDAPKPTKETPMAASIGFETRAAPVSTEVPQMSREDRRVIFEKLNAIYDKDKYSPPWTDKKVGEDLNCPRAWVKQVRDEMFGPEGSNAEIDQSIAQAKSLIEHGTKLLAQVEAVKLQLNTIQRDVAPIAAAVAKMQNQIQAIEKAVK